MEIRERIQVETHNEILKPKEFIYLIVKT